MMKNVEIRLANILTNYGIQRSKIKRETDYYNDLSIDCLDFVDLVLMIEKEFKIIIPDCDIFQLETISQTVEYLEHKAENPYSLN